MNSKSTAAFAARGPRRAPLPRVWGLLVFVWCFSRELIVANIGLARAVLAQRCEDMAPGFLTYSLEGLTPFEVLVLTHSITLTPGTTSVEISSDGSELLVHAFDARDPDAIRVSIRDGLEKPLLAWSR